MSYLDRELVFLDDRIEVAETGDQVMMSWERPIMRRMAELAAMRRGDVLEVGFGMGLCADAVQSLSPRSHTILEAHPQIIDRARQWAIDRPGVEIVAGRWQDTLSGLGPFDGIAFDIYGGDDQRLDFFSRLDGLLRPRGVATLWLGDEVALSPPLRRTLTVSGFEVHLDRVAAIPDSRCTYSQKNEFVVPIIFRPVDTTRR